MAARVAYAARTAVELSGTRSLVGDVRGVIRSRLLVSASRGGRLSLSRAAAYWCRSRRPAPASLAGRMRFGGRCHERPGRECRCRADGAELTAPMRRTQPEEARKLAAAFAHPRSGRIHDVRCCVYLGAG